MELSIKAWLCDPPPGPGGGGGKGATTSKNRIEIVPCSRVGHVFRSWCKKMQFPPFFSNACTTCEKYSFRSPYNADPEQIHRNNKRVAEVWMDEYKYVYYDRSERSNVHIPVSSQLAIKRNVSSLPFADLATRSRTFPPVWAT